jgi:tRNA pseudouridine65 synthase
VHRTSISEEKEEFALQILRDQLGVWVSPCHRIDRKTSGILVFAKSKEADAAMGKLFQQSFIETLHKVQKIDETDSTTTKEFAKKIFCE